ncbi:MAG: DNA polymerase domain-containing protein [Infirmifilum sp.]
MFVLTPLRVSSTSRFLGDASRVEVMGGYFLYDISVGDDKVKLWFKGVDGKIRVEERPFQHYFFAEEEQLRRLGIRLLDAEEVELKLFPRGTRRLLKIYFGSWVEYRRALQVLEWNRVEVYAADIPVYHKVLALYRYTPMSLEGEDYRVEALPLKTARFSLTSVAGGKYALHVHSSEDLSTTGTLPELLEDLSDILRRDDPDLVSSNLAPAELRRLVREAGHAGLRLGRGERPLEGRIFVQHSTLERIGLAGLEERSRFTMLPPTHAARASYGRMIDLRQSYTLLSRGYLVPRRMNLNVPVRTAWEIHLYDKGGLTLRPEPGLYRSVAVLDFESMFPNLIVKRNISYETVSRRGVRRQPRGLLPELIEETLRRRLYFKRLARVSSGVDRQWAEERQSELKMILVSSYGYSGNNYNRLGNPLTFEWINRASRRVMLDVIGYVRRLGYRVIYGDTDSVFLQRDGASREDYEALASTLSRRTGLPVRLDAFYDWLFLPLSRGSRAGVAKRYIGVTGLDVTAKGVEAVRSGVPRLVKEAQLRLVKSIVIALASGDVESVLEAELEAIHGELYSARPQELVCGSTLRKEEYLSRTPAYIAAQQLRANGYTVSVGDYVEYVWVDSESQNPYLRVQAWRLYDGRRLDMDKYRDMLDRALLTVLEPVRKSLGHPASSRPWVGVGKV